MNTFAAVVLTFAITLCVPQKGTFAQYVNPVPAVFINGFVPLPGQPQPPFLNQTLNRTCDPHAYDVFKSHSRFWGCKNRTDRLVFVETVDKPGRFFSTREKVLEYPGEVPKGYVRNEVITAIWCYDLVGNNHGGYCNVQSGGIGKTHVRLHLYHAQRNMPLRYRLEIYANTTQPRY